MGLSILFIAVGATCGAIVRWRLTEWLGGDATAGRISWGMLVANLLGAYLIGVATTTFLRWPNITPELRLGIVTGFLGSLTTVSGMSAEIVTFLVDRDHRTGFLLILAHVVGSLAATFLGMCSCRAWLD